MVAYEAEDLFPAPRAIVWKLLTDHLDDKKVVDIHPLIQSQTTVSRSDRDAVLDRVIDVRRKLKRSRWQITFESPDHLRWEVVESEGPWKTGSFLDLAYTDAGKETRIRAHGELEILDLPFFLSQPKTVGRVFDDLYTEDVFFLRRYRF